MISLAAALSLICTSPVPLDGDTMTCAGERVRLHGVDAPERQRPFASEATRRLAELTQGPVICTATAQGRDRYGRVVAICSGKVPDVGAQLVTEGLAVNLPRYSRGEYADEEAEARDGRKGMWR